MRNGQMGCDAGFQGMGCGVGCFVICWLAVALAVARGICIRWQRMAKGAEMRLQECLPCFCSIQPISQGTFPSLKAVDQPPGLIQYCWRATAATAGRIVTNIAALHCQQAHLDGAPVHDTQVDNTVTCCVMAVALSSAWQPAVLTWQPPAAVAQGPVAKQEANGSSAPGAAKQQPQQQQSSCQLLCCNGCLLTMAQLTGVYRS